MDYLLMQLILVTEMGAPIHPLTTDSGAGAYLTDNKDINLLVWVKPDCSHSALNIELTTLNLVFEALLLKINEAVVSIDTSNVLSYFSKNSGFIKKVLTQIADINQLDTLKKTKAPFTDPVTGELLTTLYTHWLAFKAKGFTFENDLIPGTDLEKIRQFADALAYRGALLDDTNPVIEWVDDKTLNRPKKPNTPSLLCDNLLFAIGHVDNRIPEGYLYFTGSGDMNNGKTKAAQKESNKEDSSFLYFTGSYNKLRYFGRPCAHDRFNVVLLKEAYPLIEQLKRHQASIVDKIYGLSQMTVYRLTECFSTLAQHHLLQHACNYLGVTKKGDLFTLTKSKKALTHVMYPPKLAFKIRDIFEQNTNRLFSVLDGSWETRGYALTDITGYFYQTDAKSKLKVHEDIKQNTKQIKLSVLCPIRKQLHNLLCVIGVDSPDRTAFSQWVKLNPKIQLLGIPLTGVEYQFAVIVTTDEGWMYWTCEYGSKHYLKAARKSKI